MSPSYKGHRYPVEVISHCVWLYFRFPLSFGEVEELMLQRGVIVSHETVRRWCAKFGQAYADGLRRRRPRPGDKWHLDEVFIKINGELKYLWRAVDQDGNVLDILVQNRRDKAAARQFFRRLMKKTQTVPRVIVTDKLRFYGAAHREIMPSVEHRSHKGMNNRAENSHQPTRQRERAMKGFRSVGGAQRFLSAFSGISPHFRTRRHLRTAAEHRLEMTVRFTIWDQITGTASRPCGHRHVLQVIAVELASTPLPGHLEVTALGDTTPGLDDAAPERVARIDGIAAATTDITSHIADQRRALASVGANSLRAARLSDDASGAWTPHILLAQELPDDDHVRALFDALTEKPRAAGAVITSSTHTEAPAAAWTLECQSPDATIMLPGSNLPIKLQGLSDPHFADAIELLTLAASDSDVPAPDWTRTDPDDDNAEEDAPLEEPGEDGLPAEYAQLEEEALSEDDDADTGESAATGDPQDRNEAPAPAPTVDLIKTDTDGNTQTEDVAPAAGPSLAEVLAAEDDGPEPHIPTASSPASDRADCVLTLATPCAAPAPPAVHVTIPAPSTEPEPPATPLSEPAVADGPAVLVLGPISVEGATGRIDSNRVRTATELVTYLALNSGVDHHAIDDALWPGQIVNKTMRNAVISRARSWLGKDADANAYFPRVQDTGDNRYRLGAAVTCDWTRFQRLARTGLARHDEDGDLALRRAFALVRGRPFTGIDPQRYAWAEPAVQEMVSAIVDVAHELSSRRCEAGDFTGALWSARQGLLAAEESEMLHRQVFLAHHAAGDIDALRAAAARLARINEQLGGGVDMEAQTAELLRNLLPRTVTRAR